MIVKSVHTPIIDFMCVSEKCQRISNIINNADIDDCDVNENYNNCCLVLASLHIRFLQRFCFRHTLHFLLSI